MARFSEEELAILQRARNAYPDGIDSPADDESVEYVAFVRLYDAGCIDTESEPLVFLDGGGSRARYFNCKITESGREVLEQLDEKLGEIGHGDEPMLMGLGEGRRIIIEHVRNLHGASNQLGIRITVEEVQDATEQVGRSGPKVIKKLLTEWVPSSLTSSTVKMLFDILRNFG